MSKYVAKWSPSQEGKIILIILKDYFETLSVSLWLISAKMIKCLPSDFYSATE